MAKQEENNTGYTVSVGDRVLADGHGPGVVKFVGKLDNKQLYGDRVYVGIRLDDFHIDRHDGTVGDKRYFSCKQGHGVMVPETTVQVVIKFHKLTCTPIDRTAVLTQKLLERKLADEEAKKAKIEAIQRKSNEDGARRDSDKRQCKLDVPSSSLPKGSFSSFPLF
eukprot:Colp12_sorted_trinity150504_noHs@30223